MKICSANFFILAALLLAVLELPAPANAKRKNKKKNKSRLEQHCKLETNEALCDMGNADSTSDSRAPQLPDLSQLEITRKYPGTIVQVLEAVNQKLKMKEDDIRDSNRFLDRLVKKNLVEDFKKQTKLFEKIAWSGSFYEGLKISHPDEFDLNIVFRFPFKNDLIKISPRSDTPGFVTIKNFKRALDTIEPDPSWRPVYKEMLKWTDESGNLLANKVRDWMESIISKFANEYNVGKADQDKIIVRKAGPAMTLCIRELNIDVVPAFSFKSVPPTPIRAPKPLNRVKELKGPKSIAANPQTILKEWYIVPKPLKGQVEIKDAWRVSFYEFEKDILRDYGTIKPAIKLIKKLRDTQNWKSLYSYAIKSAALWMKENAKLSENDRLDITFLNLLKGIRDYLKQGFLPFFWDKRANMLRMSDAERANLGNRIARLIIRIEENWERNPSYIGELIYPLN